MTQKEFLRYWYRAAAVTAAVTLMVVTLLVAIMATAQGIRRKAASIVRVLGEVVDNTGAIWKLADTDVMADRLLKGAQSIRSHAGEIADALEGQRATATGEETQ